MLVHHFVTGNRPLFTKEQGAETITLAVFGRLHDPEISNLPFIQEREIKGNYSQFFCFENQFVIECWEYPDRYEYKPHWHCYSEDAPKREQAIATLHDALFKQQGQAIGY